MVSVWQMSGESPAGFYVRSTGSQHRTNRDPHKKAKQKHQSVTKAFVGVFFGFSGLNSNGIVGYCNRGKLRCFLAPCQSPLSSGSSSACQPLTQEKKGGIYPEDPSFLQKMALKNGFPPNIVLRTVSPTKTDTLQKRRGGWRGCDAFLPLLQGSLHYNVPEHYLVKWRFPFISVLKKPHVSIGCKR